MKCILVITLLIALAQAQFFDGPGSRRFGGVGGGMPFGPGGARGFGGPGARGQFGPGGARGFGGMPFGPGGARGFGGMPFGPGGARGFGGPIGGFGGFGARVVPVAPVMVAPVMPIGRFGMGGFAMPGFGMGGFGMGGFAMPVATVPVVVRPRVIVGRSVPESFNLTYSRASHQILLTFGNQRIGCEVKPMKVHKLENAVLSMTAMEPSHIDFLYDMDDNKQSKLISIYRERMLFKNRGLLVKSEVCYDAIYNTINDELKATKFDLNVVE